MLSGVRILFYLTVVFAGVTCLSVDAKRDYVHFPDKGWDYSNFWVDDHEDDDDFEDPIPLNPNPDYDPATSKTPVEISSPHYPENSVLDLLNVVRLNTDSKTPRPRKPQQRLLYYMTELYNNLTLLSDNLGSDDKNPDPAGKGIIPDSGTSIRGMQAYQVFLHWNGSYTVWFNYSDVSWTRMPQQAELVLSPRHTTKIGGRFRRGRLLDTQELSDEEDGGDEAEENTKPHVWQKMVIRNRHHARSYYVLDVTDGVRDWIDDMQHLGPNADYLPLKLTTFSQSTYRPVTLMKPFLVLYYGIQHNALSQRPPREREPRQVLQREGRSAVASSPQTSSVVPNKCSLHDWYISFEELGWDSWALFPSGVRLNYCSGECPAILIQSEYRASNHAMLRGIYRSKQPSSNAESHRVPLACCVPTRLRATNIMYLEEQKVIIRRLDDMVAEECGCQ